MKKRTSGLFLLMAILPAAAIGQCPGDCRGDGQVRVDELITSVNIALGSTTLSECMVSDTNGDEEIAINELITAVNNAVNGCPVSQPTFTRTPLSRPTPTPTSGIVSPALLGIWSGLGVESTTGQPRSVRIKIEVMNGQVIVTDLDGNVFVGRSSITVMANTPTTLLFMDSNTQHVETLQLGLNPADMSILNGTYANLVLTGPLPVGTSVAMTLTKDAS